MTIGVGIIGTGFAARKRVEALQQDGRARGVAVAGSPGRVESFGERYRLKQLEHSELCACDELDLVIVCTTNADHGRWVQLALEQGRHVVVEYPLALDVSLARRLVQLARQRHQLLHVEHIELIGGLHQAAKRYLPTVGTPYHVSYRTIAPQQPVAQKWSYRLDRVGFPLMAALSRIQRLSDLFGPVEYVTCQGSIKQQENYFSRCLYSAQLRFVQGTLGELTYGKGERLWERSRRLEIRGDQGYLEFDGDRGRLVSESGEQPVAVAPRQGLFKRDTEWVLDHLLEQRPLYVQPEASLYSLEVAAALENALASGTRVAVTAKPS